MNNMILKEIYRSVLFSKLASKYPFELKTEASNNTYQEIHKIILNNNIIFIENDTLKCYMFKYTNTIYITIHSLLKYYDFKELIRLKDNIFINDALFSQYKSFEEQIIKNINELNNTKLIKKIYLCGYNSGGALAILTSALLADKYKNIFLVSCFSFGSPKIGNKHFRKYFNKYITCNYRIKIENDLYTKTYWYNYYHISNALLLENDNIKEIEEIDQTIYDNLLLSIKKNKINYIENTITIDDYIKRLHNLISLYQSNIMNKDINIYNLLNSNSNKNDNNKNDNINDIVLSSKLYA